MGDGMPKMMTGDDFFNVVTAHEKAAEEAKKGKGMSCTAAEQEGNGYGTVDIRGQEVCGEEQ